MISREERRRRASLNGRLSKTRSAYHIDLLSRGAVSRTERLTAVCRVSSKHAHSILQALIARRLRPTRQRDAEGEVVDVAAGRSGGVGDGVGEAVVSVRVGEAACVVGGLVGYEAGVRLRHDGVAHLVVGAAVFVFLDFCREVGHD